MIDKNIIQIKKKPTLSENEIYLVSSFFGFCLGLLLFVFYSPNYNRFNTPVELKIEAGATLNNVIDTLYEKTIIPNKTIMRIAAFISGSESMLKAGRYKIPNAISYMDLLELLVEGTSADQVLVTIPEGIWQPGLAGLLRKSLGIDSVKFLELSKDKGFLTSLNIRANTIEGYLLPESYYFYSDADAIEVVKRLKNEMDKLFEADSVKRQMKQLGMDQHKILTLASIIEGESNIISEFKTISGVYHNRLEKGMILQADPTIQYLIRDRKKKNRILFKDLEIDSKYNTYIYAGLPPGPINNPGKDAVMAALFPENNQYYYFVADGSGGHIFAKTLNEHNKNVSNYRKWRSTQK